MDILDCFAFLKTEMGLFEIARHTGLNKTTAKRLLSNLTDRRYLQQDPKTKAYRLGLRLFELGGIVFSSFSLRKAAAHPMSILENETGAAVLLGVMMENQLAYVDKREGEGVIRVPSNIGWRKPLHFGVLGMVLMAYMGTDQVDVILEQYPLTSYTSRSITDTDRFKARLEEIRRRGYAVERSEAVEGVAGIAAPVWNYTRKVIAALGIIFPSRRVSSKKALKDMASRLKEACNEISADLGYPVV